MQSLRSYGIGDRACLNSGGPDMLIVDLVGSAAVIVSWRDRNGYVHESTFPNQCVYAIRDPEIQSSI